MGKASATTSLASAGGSLLGSLLGGSKPKTYNTGYSINGQEVASANVNNGKISTNYNMSDYEKELQEYTNKNLLSGLENINVFSPEVQKSIDNQVKAYTSQGINTLNDTYTPMFRNLRNDIASRFGNLDNSVFMDNLNEIEKNRTNALATLTENILAKQSELYEAEMNNRYNYLNQLTSVNQNLNSNILNFLKLASSNTGV
ncbi:MAG: hypothetical protein NC390_03700 [Fusobacterium sp.]|nr:hypothetical protein [Fusobacterium sp.]